MGNCKSEINFPDNSNFLLQCNNPKSVPKAEDIFLSIVKIQAIFRGCLARRKYKNYFASHREEKTIKSLQEYSQQILSTRKIKLPPFNYSLNKPEIPLSSLSLAKLETADSKITYYGEW